MTNISLVTNEYMVKYSFVPSAAYFYICNKKVGIRINYK